MAPSSRPTALTRAFGRPAGLRAWPRPPAFRFGGQGGQGRGL